MRRCHVACVSILAALGAIAEPVVAQTEPKAVTEKMTPVTLTKIKVLNIWEDAQGKSHFRDIEFAPDKPFDTTNTWFVNAKAGTDMDWHPAPRRQLVVILGPGSAEFTASDGEKRVVPPGGVLLVEDTKGQGHKSKLLGGLPLQAIFIGLPERSAR